MLLFKEAHVVSCNEPINQYRKAHKNLKNVLTNLKDLVKEEGHLYDNNKKTFPKFLERFFHACSWFTFSKLE